MVKELTELRAIKAAHEKLAQSYNDLSRLVARVTGVAMSSAPAAKTRKPGRPVGSKSKPTGSGGKRFRSTAADVQKAYEALVAKTTKEWMTKEDICKAAGYKPAQVAAAWKRLVEGGKDASGKAIKPILESNGSRGLQGRYRRR